MYLYKILQNYSDDMFHSSILIFDKESYLFNCCDGTQRNALDQGVKFIKIKEIFYNSSHLDCYLGTYGLIMSRGEQAFSQLIATNEEFAKKVKENTKYSIKNKKEKEKNNNKNEPIKTQCYLFGPPGFSENFKYSNNFCPVSNLGKSLYDYDIKDNSFVNKNIITGINSPNIKEIKDSNLQIIPICINPKSTLNNKNDYSMSYIIIPNLKRPPFLIEKAKSLGLKPGPIYSKLQKGESVTLDDGRIIKPEDVLGESHPSSAVYILYLPSFEHMKLLINDKNLTDKIINKKNYINSLVVHITPFYNIINNEDYIKFMGLFGNETQHIIDCKETNRQFMYNEGKIKIQILLNKVSSYLFKENNMSYEDTLSKKDLNLIDNICIENCIPGSEYILYPHERRGKIEKGLYEGEAFYYKSHNYEQFIKNIDDIEIENFDKIENIENKIKNNNEDNIELTFLGTTSMKPCKYRNVSSILINLLKYKKYIMFDCGEGTFQQLLEHFGKEKTKEIIKNINLISVSHKHGDHMLGLLKLLKEIDDLINDEIENTEYIYVIVPKNIIEFIINSINLDLIHKKYFKVFESNQFNPSEIQIYQKNLLQDNPHENYTDIEREKEYNKIKKRITTFIEKNENISFYNDLKNKLGIIFYTAEVFHCEESYGMIIESNCNESDKNYFKISFSGDTRPCNNFFNYTMNSTLFIHEGTFDNEMVKDAKEKMHSTISEAINLGKENGSKYIAITHFSPRYIKTYPYKKEFDDEKVLIAHDYCSFKLNDLEFAYKYLKYFDKVMNYIENTKEKSNIL